MSWPRAARCWSREGRPGRSTPAPTAFDTSPCTGAVGPCRSPDARAALIVTRRPTASVISARAAASWELLICPAYAGAPSSAATSPSSRPFRVAHAGGPRRNRARRQRARSPQAREGAPPGAASGAGDHSSRGWGASCDWLRTTTLVQQALEMDAPAVWMQLQPARQLVRRPAGAARPAARTAGRGAAVGERRL
jgi:hypothetical protein